jgi:hypothetical protein
MNELEMENKFNNTLPDVINRKWSDYNSFNE